MLGVMEHREIKWQPQRSTDGMSVASSTDSSNDASEARDTCAVPATTSKDGSGVCSYPPPAPPRLRMPSKGLMRAASRRFAASTPLDDSILGGPSKGPSSPPPPLSDPMPSSAIATATATAGRRRMMLAGGNFSREESKRYLLDLKSSSENQRGLLQAVDEKPPKSTATNSSAGKNPGGPEAKQAPDLTRNHSMRLLCLELANNERNTQALCLESSFALGDSHGRSFFESFGLGNSKQFLHDSYGRGMDVSFLGESNNNNSHNNSRKGMFPRSRENSRRRLASNRGDSKRFLESNRADSRRVLKAVRADSKRFLDACRADSKRLLQTSRGNSKRVLDLCRAESKRFLDLARMESKRMMDFGESFSSFVSDLTMSTICDQRSIVSDLTMATIDQTVQDSFYSHREPPRGLYQHQHEDEEDYYGYDDTRGDDNRANARIAEGQPTPLVEVFPGVFESLRGAAETWEAVEQDFFMPIECVTCASNIFCIQDSRYVLCPHCRVVGPMTDDEHAQGVGLGFTFEQLSSWQGNILSNQRQSHQRQQRRNSSFW